MRLSEATIGTQGVIVKVEEEDLAIALLRVGMLPGDRFELMEIAPFGGPISVRVCGSKLAMRRDDAAKVIIDTRA